MLPDRIAADVTLISRRAFLGNRFPRLLPYYHGY